MSYPYKVKQRIREIVESRNKDKALEICKEIIENDLFICVSIRDVKEVELLESCKFPSVCQWKMCGLQIHRKESIYRAKGIGCWHKKCFEENKEAILKKVEKV